MRAPGTRHAPPWLAAAAVVAVVAVGCGSVLPVAPTPHDATAVFRPASMVAGREMVAPGEVVELTFPDEMTRGIHFVLEEEAGSTWVYRYGLIAAPEPAGAPTWFAPEDEDVAIPDIGVIGRGPDRVVIPAVAQPGSWRICTGNAVENVCVRIEITGL